MEYAQPLMSTHYAYGESSLRDSTAWDGDTMYTCVCDSNWEVGLSRYQTQLPEYFGPDCSLRKSTVLLFLYFPLCPIVSCVLFTLL
jgi:hypothetical protein